MTAEMEGDFEALCRGMCQDGLAVQASGVLQR